MAKKKPDKKNGRIAMPKLFVLPEEVKKWILGIIILIIAVIIVLSFFDMAGVAGNASKKALIFLIGNTVFITPLILILGGLVFFGSKREHSSSLAVLAMIVLMVGITGFMESFAPQTKQGGLVGLIFSWPFLKFFGGIVSKIVFAGMALAGSLIFWHLFGDPNPKPAEKEEKKPILTGFPEDEESESLIKKIFAPKFKVKEIEPREKKEQAKTEEQGVKPKPAVSTSSSVGYQIPSIDLLETEKGVPSAGDTIANSAIIKKTLENFSLGVEMAEINIGPTVTQYAFKPADGIKLSKITALSNNLSLALAAHPIRIEAPIPGKALVGVEVPNKTRCRVRIKDIISAPLFQGASSNLTLVLGKDVSGNPCCADLAKMPHLLVAGSTGTGKTVFLNSLILSLLYQNNPDNLKLILIDPKRVEFCAYHDIPHLLAPVIFDSQKAVNALRWLVSEMERRFSVLASNGSRNISSYNEKVVKDGESPMPCIVLIIDELADLMAARGREVESGIVRLAQMARAVGIHLVVATQRPSVEVITGLIKANITSRITFQVASQVDSRTILDMAGAEKLIGLGDLLFISAEIGKPKRIQGAYVSEKEIKRVIDFIKSQSCFSEDAIAHEIVEGSFASHSSNNLEKSLEISESFSEFGGEDPLYEEAKRMVCEAKKASASLLQRRLRIGYARAARLVDMLENKGIVGPGEGARPREVLIDFGNKELTEEFPILSENEENGEWKKV